MRIWIVLIIDFVLAAGMMSSGVYEKKRFSGYNDEDWKELERSVGSLATFAAILLSAGVLQGCVWVLGLVGLSRKLDGRERETGV